ncbi:MAG: diaminopimelate decarboxylase [Planctomycetota bacterium]
MTATSTWQETWWSRPDLRYTDGTLRLAGHRLGEIAHAAGMPTFCYSAERVRTKLELLRAALGRTGRPGRVFYAMKANRFVPLLSFLRTTGLCGIDACSPRELQLALACGFAAADVSYTATSVSNADLDVLVRHPDCIVNCDSLSSLRRLGERSPGRSIGLRINPGKGVGYGDSELLTYSGAKTTKFGIYREHLDEALRVAAQFDLAVHNLHFHVGIGYQTRQLPLWEEILGICATFAEQIPDLRRINLGGGLGVPHRAGDDGLDLDAWAAVIARQFGSRDVEIAVEPGDFLVKDAGVLVLQANTVEKKRDTLFVGVDGGFNLAVEPAFYGMPCEPTPCELRSGPAQVVTIAGNINEALDIWHRDVSLPPIHEGDYIAFLNAGGYASAMSSDHCMRGQFYERLLFPSGADVR